MRCFVLAAALAGFSVSVAAGPLRLDTEEYPPFNYMDPATRQITGMSVELVREAMTRTGTAATIDILPWQRAYAEALGNPDTCVFSTSITEDRKPLFKWVGPLVANDWTLFARADRGIRITSLDDARPYRIGGYQGDAAAEFMKRNGFDVDASIRDDLNPAKLMSGRIDLWITGNLRGLYLLKSQHIDQIRPVFAAMHVDMALACNPGIPDQTITALSSALAAIKADGTAEKIQARYR